MMGEKKNILAKHYLKTHLFFTYSQQYQLITINNM